MKLHRQPILLAVMAIVVTCVRPETNHRSTVPAPLVLTAPDPPEAATAPDQRTILPVACTYRDFKDHLGKYQHLQVMGYVGGHVFTFVPYAEQQINFPMDLTKLLKYQRPNDSSIAFSTFDAEGFKPVVRLHQGLDHNIHVVQIGVRDLIAVDSENQNRFLQLVTRKDKQKPEVLYKIVKDKEHTMYVFPVTMQEGDQIIPNKHPFSSTHSFVLNTTLYVGGGRVVNDRTGYKLIKLAEATPTLGIERPICDVVPRANVNKACMERFPKKGVEVNGLFEGIVSTARECKPFAEGLKPLEKSKITVPSEVGLLTLKVDGWSCHIMTVPSKNKSCLYAFGPSAVFQSIQVGPVAPVTTTTPAPYTHRPVTDPHCHISDGELFDKFVLLEYHGGCLLRHDKLPKNNDADEAIVDTKCLRSVYSDRDTTRLDEAVFVPYDEKRFVLVAQYDGVDGLTMGCAIVRMPELDHPTYMDGFDEYWPIEGLSSRDIVRTDGNIFLLEDGKITDLFHTRPYFTPEGRKWFPCVHEPVEEKNELYEDANLNAQRKSRKPFAYLNSDAHQKPWSVINGYAIRYENVVATNESGIAYRKVDVIKSPYCAPRMLNLRNRRLFLAPRSHDLEQEKAEKKNKKDVDRIRETLRKQRERERLAAEAAAARWAIVKGFVVFAIVTAQFSIVVWLKFCLDRQFAEDVANAVRHID